MRMKTTPKWDEHWQALTRLVELEDGFYSIFILTDETQTVAFLQDQLRQRFRCATIATPTAATEKLYYDVMQGLTTHINAANSAETEIVIVDLHRYLVNEPLKVLLARLNERREWLRNGLKIPLIFILSTKTDVGRYAPDFWSIRDLVLFLNGTLIHEKFSPRPENIFLNFWYGLTDWFSGIHRRYSQQIIYEHRFFNIKGLRTRGEYSVELEHVFVELRIAPSTAPNQPHRDLLTAKELQGNQPIWEFLRFGNKQQDQLLLAIIGAPGCGKTTLLQHVALQFATKSPPKLPRWIPVLLFLRQHVTTILSERPALADLVQQHFSNSKRYPNLQPPPHWFQRSLHAGKCLILLDGLDEVANAEERKQISAWIDEQIVHYPRCPFVVTSRPQGYHAAPLSRATIVLEVQAFTTTQVKQFIDSWYLATEITSYGGKDDPGVRLRAKQEAEDLQLRLQARPSLVDLTVNPLLLTMIAMVHRYRGQLPGRRVELYAEICDVLLGHWREAKGIQDSLTAAQKRVALQPLAAWMMENSVREIDITTAITVIREPLQTVGLVSDIEEFLKDIQASSGLFAEREMGVWSFAHLTFQEYLAAAHYKDQKIHGNWWHRKVTDSWWHETLLLYAAQTDATPIIKSCLNSNIPKTLSLAADCLDEALQLDAVVRQQVETLLIENLESNDPELFKLAAEVKLQRRLKNLQRIDDKREIDRTFISRAEYQLFLDERREKREFYQPDHWLDFHFPKGSALQPIAGVRAEDAEKFCNWLSQKENKKYRLPTLAEAQESLAVENQEFATWCNCKNLQWTSVRMQQLFERKRDNILRRIWVNGYSQQDRAIFEHSFDETHEHNIHALEDALRLPNIALSIELTSDLNQSRIPRFNETLRILAFAKNLSVGFQNVKNSLEENFREKDPSTVLKSLELAQKLSIQNPVEERRKNLLIALLRILTGKTVIEKISAWRIYIGYLAEYAINGYESLESRKNFRLTLSFITGKSHEFHEKKDALKVLCTQIKIVEARQKGELPAWEGIRIVRERDV
jgi:energy-coupling factor transporter ATP-binding protein EcfA2